MGQGGTVGGVVAQAPRPHRPRAVVALVGLLADVVVVIAASLLLWTALPSLGLQATPRVITDDLMAPLVRSGDVLLIVAPEDPVHGLLAPGAIVVTDPTRTARRIVRTDLDGYGLRGDAQGLEEPEAVAPQAVVGVGRFLIPWVGLPAHWIRTRRWDALTVGAAVLVAAVAMSSSGGSSRVHGRGTTAERGTRALPTLEQRRAAEREARRRARHDRGARSVAGGLLLLAVVIGGVGTSQPAYATMQADLVETGSRFSVALDQPGPPGEPLTVFRLPAHEGAPSYVADQQDEILAFAIPVTATQRLTGPVTTELLLAPSTPGNPDRTVEVALVLDDTVIATSTQTFRTTDPRPTVRRSTLGPALAGLDIGPGDRFEVRITLRRLELFLDPGPSLLRFP